MPTAVALESVCMCVIVCAIHVKVQSFVGHCTTESTAVTPPSLLLADKRRKNKKRNDLFFGHFRPSPEGSSDRDKKEKKREKEGGPTDQPKWRPGGYIAVEDRIEKAK